MRSKTAALMIADLLVVLVLVGGCSGPGVDAEDVRGGDVQAAATDHLSAVTLVASWVEVLYAKLTTGSARNRLVDAADIQRETLPDGSEHGWGTTLDGAEFDQILRPDESGNRWERYPDGKTNTMEWDAPVEQNQICSVAIRQTYWDQSKLDYTVTIDESTHTWCPRIRQGTATLADGRQMAFTQTRQPAQDSLALQLPDNSTLDVQIPVSYGFFTPVFSEPTQGTFTSPAGVQQNITLTGDQGGWNRWQFTSPDGETGDFTLEDNMQGSGRMERNGNVVAALRWSSSPRPDGTRNIAGVLDIVAARSTDVTPSAAARAFQIDRWVQSIAEMGPNPKY